MAITRITSFDLLDTPHGFFQRGGGSSSGIFTSLNCGTGSSDINEVVRLNRSRVAHEMGVEPEALMGVHQVHSADVITVTEPGEERPRADAMVTSTPGIALSVLTADCQPVLFADAEAGVIGAAHAGWRGAVDGVLGNTVDAMEALGAERARIRAVIGPCISQQNYEVGEEFFERFADEDPSYTQYFTHGAPGKYLFNLPGFGLKMLREAGIEHAHWVQRCTYAEEDAFYSYRRSVHRAEPDYGRLISAITLPEGTPA